MLFSNLTGRKAVASVPVVGTQTIPMSMGGKPYLPAVRAAADLQATIVRQYERVVWTYAAVRAISSNAARLKIICRDGDPDVGESIDNQLLPLLNWKPNDVEPAAFFRQRLSAQRLLSPRGAFVEKVVSRGGDLLGMFLLPPHNVKPIPSSRAGRLVDGFELTVGSNKRTLSEEQVLWFREPHPLDPYRSMTPLEVAGIAIDTDMLAAIYNNTFLKNDGRPGGVIGIKGRLTPEDADELKSYFAGGANRAGEWRVFEADGVDVNDLSVSPRDAAWLEARAAAKIEILDAFGLGETILGNASGRTFANADAEREVFWEQTEVPHCEAETDVWDQVDNNPDTFLRHDYSTVPALQRAKQTRDAELRDEFQRGLISVDEYREATGRPKLGLPSTGALLVGFSVSPLAGTDGAEPVAAPTPDALTDEPIADDVQPIPEPKKALALPEADVAVGALDATDAVPLSRSKAVISVNKFHDKWEPVMYDALSKHFDRQRRAVLAKLKGPKALHGTRHWDGPARDDTKAISVGSVYDIARWDSELLSAAEDLVGSMMDAAGRSVIDASGVNKKAATAKAAVNWNLHNPKVTKRIKAQTKRIVQTNATTRDSIRSALAKGDAAGESVPQLAARVSAVFDAAEYRYELIARTEVASAHNGGLIEGARQSGVVEKKEWLAIGDHRTRPAHLDVDGTKVGLDDKFTVDGEDMDGPGDSSASGANVCNCRCSLLFDF